MLPKGRDTPPHPADTTSRHPNAPEIASFCIMLPTNSSYPLQGGFRSQLKQALRIFSGITLAENGIPRYQDFYSGAHGFDNRTVRHASVNFDPEVGPARGTHGSQFAHLVQRRRDELLRSEPRIHGHHEHMVHHVQYFAQGLHRSGGINYHARIRTLAADQLQRAMEMNTSFLMHADPIRTRIHPKAKELIKILHH